MSIEEKRTYVATIDHDALISLAAAAEKAAEVAREIAETMRGRGLIKEAQESQIRALRLERAREALMNAPEVKD